MTCRSCLYKQRPNTQHENRSASNNNRQTYSKISSNFPMFLLFFFFLFDDRAGRNYPSACARSWNEQVPVAYIWDYPRRDLRRQRAEDRGIAVFFPNTSVNRSCDYNVQTIGARAVHRSTESRMYLRNTSKAAGPLSSRKNGINTARSPDVASRRHVDGKSRRAGVSEHAAAPKRDIDRSPKAKKFV